MSCQVGLFGRGRQGWMARVGGLGGDQKPGVPVCPEDMLVERGMTYGTPGRHSPGPGARAPVPPVSPQRQPTEFWACL